jgi:ParB/Sulfiredoxin domain
MKPHGSLVFGRSAVLVVSGAVLAAELGELADLLPECARCAGEVAAANRRRIRVSVRLFATQAHASTRKRRRSASTQVQLAAYTAPNSMTVQTMLVSQIKPNPRNLRTHSAKQVRQIANSIVAFKFRSPCLVNEDGELIAGHGRYLAAKLLGLTKIPVIVVAGLSAAEQRALAIADNKIAENAGWDRERLAIEIPQLSELLSAEGLDVSILGFEPVEIDQLQADFEEDSSDPQDSIEPQWLQAAPVSQLGDLWILGNHQLMCGDARRADHISKLMTGCRADMAFLDVPYNLKIGGVVGRGKTKHAEFAMASGEMSSSDYVCFLGIVLDAFRPLYVRFGSSLAIGVIFAARPLFHGVSLEDPRR